MGRYSAPSDIDYEDEMNPHLRRPDLRCPSCGEEMVMLFDGNDRPMWARCESCRKAPHAQTDRRSA